MTEIKRIWEEIKYFWNKKCFSIGIPLMMLLSYGTALLYPTVGIDDTSFNIYYEDGVSPAMGRWCLFLINKLFPLNYNPFFVEAVGLLFFCISITLWCIVFHRMFGDMISDLGYTIFGCVMLSCPIISELSVWYLQNGTYLGYGVTALAVLFGMESFREGVSKSKRAGYLGGALIFLTIAIGFYESFMIVFLIAMLMVFLLIRVLHKEEFSVRIGRWFLNIIILGIGTVLLRTIINKLMIWVFDLESQTLVLRSRGIYEVLGWFNGTKGFNEFSYVMKDFFIKYYINGAVYLPITILVSAIGILILFGTYRSIKQKDGWILAAVAGIILLPWLMPFLEGVATYYRTSQYIPLVSAFAVLIIAWFLEYHQVKRYVRIISLFLAFVLLYNQGYEMNKWLYIESRKYEDTKRTLDHVALTIMEQCDASKPICVVGKYDTPESLIKEAYCPSWSKKYTIVSTLVKMVDEDIFNVYNTPYGYAFAETPQLSFIKWGATAFYGFDREIIKFWKMHGFTFTEDGNLNHYDNARNLMADGPVWPEEGSVIEMEDYIIVNFGND